MSISAGTTLRLLRERKPLVHQITNYVVMNETANATLALGALPVMAHAREEVEEMVTLADALVLNIGTLSPHWVEAMLVAGKAANAHGVPVGNQWWAYSSLEHPEDIRRIRKDYFQSDDQLLTLAMAARAPGNTTPEVAKHDWALARDARHRIILAGGLDASNVARAVSLAQPWGVDSCSRIESSPGIKDHMKMIDFLLAAKAALCA